MKGRYTATKKGLKKGYRVLKDKATALKKSVTCKAKKVARIDRKISKSLTPKKKDSVVKKYNGYINRKHKNNIFTTYVMIQ